jgi:hypothetical protein
MEDESMEYRELKQDESSIIVIDKQATSKPDEIEP